MMDEQLKTGALRLRQYVAELTTELDKFLLMLDGTETVLPTVTAAKEYLTLSDCALRVPFKTQTLRKGGTKRFSFLRREGRRLFSTENILKDYLTNGIDKNHD